MRQPTKAHAAFRRMLALQNVRAAYLQAKHRVITERLAALERARKEQAA